MWLIIVSLLVLALIIYVIFESLGYRKVYFNISSDDYKGDKLKIVFLADLHNKKYGINNEKIIHSIEEFNPDLVIFGGDMVTSGWDFSFDFNHTLKFMEDLSAKFPIYYAPGNHEEYFRYMADKFPGKYEELTDAIKSYGIHYLDNSNESLDKWGIRIYGLNLSYDYYKKFHSLNPNLDDINELIGAVDDNVFSVLIAHNPYFFDVYSKWGADMVLSGHVHGGIVSLPYLGGVIGPGFKLFPKYDAGLFYENDSFMLLTRGIGTHLIPIRVRNKAEIVCITLEGECNES